MCIFFSTGKLDIAYAGRVTNVLYTEYLTISQTLYVPVWYQINVSLRNLK